MLCQSQIETTRFLIFIHPYWGNGARVRGGRSVVFHMWIIHVLSFCHCSNKNVHVPLLKDREAMEKSFSRLKRNSSNIIYTECMLICMLVSSRERERKTGHILIYRLSCCVCVTQHDSEALNSPYFFSTVFIRNCLNQVCSVSYSIQNIVTAHSFHSQARHIFHYANELCPSIKLTQSQV